MNEQVLSIESFKSGLVTSMPDTVIPDDAFSDCQNIELDDKYIPTKSLGHQKYNQTSIANKPIRGLAVYKLKDGTKYYVCACNGKLWYSLVGSRSWNEFQIGGSAVTMQETANVEIVQYNDCLYIVNGCYPVITNYGYSDSRMLKIDDTNVFALDNSDIPKGGKYIIIHQERLFIANTSEEPNGLFWSEPFDPEDWTPDYGLNYDYVGKDDGEYINGIISFQGYVFVGKPHNIYRYSTQGDITQWTSNKIDTKYGFTFHRTIKEFQGNLIYLSPDGVAMFDGNNSILVSEAIKNKIYDLQQIKTYIKKIIFSDTIEFSKGTYGVDFVDITEDEINLIGQDTYEDFNSGTFNDTMYDEQEKCVKLGYYNKDNLAKLPGTYLDYISGDDYEVGYPLSNIVNGNIYSGWKSKTSSTTETKGFYLHLPSIYDIVVIKIFNLIVTEAVSDFIIETSTGGWGEGGTIEELARISVTPSKKDYIVIFNPKKTIGNFRFRCNCKKVEIGEVEIFSYIYNQTGYWESRVLDFGFTPERYGNLVVSDSYPEKDESIKYYTNSSNDGVTWEGYQECPSIEKIKKSILSTPARYLKIKAVFNSDTTTRSFSPSLWGIYTGATYLSAVKDLGYSPTKWGNIDVVASGDIRVFLRTSDGVSWSNWIQQEPNSKISNLPLERYIQLKIELSENYIQVYKYGIPNYFYNIPYVESVIINYYPLGTSESEPCSVVWKNSYWLTVADEKSSINNIVYTYNKDGYWLKRTEKYANCWAIDEDILLSGSSKNDGFIRINEVGNSYDLLINKAPYSINDGGITIIGNELFVVVGNNTKIFLKYNLTTNQWTKLADLPKEVVVSSITSDKTRYIYILFGNSSPTSEFWRYDTTTDSWAQMADYPYEILVGYSITYNDYSVSPEIWFIDVCSTEKFGTYNISGNFWAISTGLPFSTSSIYTSITAHSSMYGSVLYVFLSSGTIWKYYYDPYISGYIWGNLTTYPLQSEITKGCIIHNNGFLYCTIGNKKFYRFDLSKNEWLKLRDAPYYISGSDTLTTDGINIYALRNQNTDDIAVYNIEENTWGKYSIDSWFTTKNFTLLSFMKIFRIMSIYSKSDTYWTLSYSIDDKEYTDIEIKPQNFIKITKKILTGIVSGVKIKIKIRSILQDSNFQFSGMQTIWAPLRQLRADE